ncbi:MAG TPA: 30S ribosomal protein S27ae [Candidatus Nanoarchaeia archaeon]|nr:30S ribosomal protein S27ae [Candidatus Nanoarchaeia archaeon]
MAEKKAEKKKVPSGIWKRYAQQGESLTRPKSCPKCGPGVFMGTHKSRISCGRCKYTEFTK